MNSWKTKYTAISRKVVGQNVHATILIRDGPLENLWGVGKLQKKYLCKNSCAPVNPKKYSCYRLEKIHKKEFENEKKTAAAQKFPTPLITFLVVCP